MTDDHLSERLSAILHARSVAVVGASEDRSKLGGRALSFLISHGYAGKIFPVNPSRRDVHGLPAYPSLADIPSEVDVALVAVPAMQTVPVVEACAAKRVKGVVILSSGFAESGEAGLKRQEELVRVAESGGVLIIGPNCLGIVNVHHRLVLSSAVSLNEDLIPGNIALVSQSGVLLGTLLGRAHDRGIGFSHLISCGNQAMVEAADFVRLFVRDRGTTAIAVYIEGFKKPGNFLQAAEKARAAGKPLVVLKAGVTEAGARAARSHTGSLASSELGFEALCQEMGIVRVSTPDELIETAALLASAPLASGDGVAVVGSSGGLCSIIADRLTVMGVRLARLGEGTRRALASRLGSWRPENPFDFGASSRFDIDAILHCIDAISEDADVGALYIAVSDLPGMETYVAGLAQRWQRGPRKPWCVYWFASRAAAGASYEAAKRSGMPLFTGMDESLRAVRNILACSRPPAEARPRGAWAAAEDSSLLSERTAALRWCCSSPTDVDALTLIERYGIPVVPHAVARSIEEAQSIAASIGYPVALKVVSPIIPHKARIGGVRLDLRDAASVGQAFAEIMSNLRAAGVAADGIRGVLVQAMAASGIEVIIGATNDQFGRLLLFGLGGIFAEALGDVTARLVPVSRAAAGDMLRQVRGWPLLEELFERCPARRDELIEVMVRASRLAEDLPPEISGFDINPLIVPTGEGPVQAVDALLVKSDEVQDGLRNH